MFEAVHGSAPDIADQNLANPTALLLSGLLMLDHIGERRAAGADPRRRSTRVLADGPVRTRDLGGTATTTEFTEAICREIEPDSRRRFDIVRPVLPDDITQAVLARKDVARYLRGGHGQSELEARERIHAYLDELRTTQRYPIYRALKHPLYPILRKVERIDEHVDIAQQATRDGPRRSTSRTTRVASRLSGRAAGARRQRHPPAGHGRRASTCSAARSGLLHRHVTGAIPIRRNTKDPAYLVTLKAYVAELLQRHDLLFYIEGGRSYTGELKAPKTGLLHAALQADVDGSVIVPVAVAYDLVLEDHILPHQAREAPARGRSAREVAEMVRYAVGYQSRAFVTFGPPIPLGGYDPESRRDVMALGAPDPRRDRRALQGAADGGRRRGDAAVDDATRSRSARRRASSTRCARRTRTSACRAAARPSSWARRLLADRNIIHFERGGRFRVRERTVLRYYARTIQHLLAPRRAAPHPLMLGARLEGFFHPRRQSDPETIASRYGMRARAELRAPLHRRRDRRAKRSRPRARSQARRPRRDARLPRRERGDDRRRPTPRPAPTSASSSRSPRAGIERNISLKLTQLGLTSIARPASTISAAFSTPAAAQRLLRPHRHGELAVHRGHARHLRDDLAAGLPQRRRRAAVVSAAQRSGRRSG